MLMTVHRRLSTFIVCLAFIFMIMNSEEMMTEVVGPGHVVGDNSRNQAYQDQTGISYLNDVKHR